jgi:hypothetical protein
MIEKNDILCPTSGDVCPALSRLSDLYLANEDNVDHDIATGDRIKFTIKKAEIAGRAALSGCMGVNEVADVCPVRTEMDESSVRRGLVSTVRALLGNI